MPVSCLNMLPFFTGAMYFCRPGSMHINGSDTIMKDNVAGRFGGAIYACCEPDFKKGASRLSALLLPTNYDLALEGCKIQNNTAFASGGEMTACPQGFLQV